MSVINVGVDLGSTYSAVSVFDKDMNFVKAINVEMATPYTPSCVALQGKNKYTYGLTAKGKTGKSNVRLFNAFKMLLPEENHKKLQEYKYDIPVDGRDDDPNVHTPKQITKMFLDYILRKTLNSLGADMIDHLVVGIPEIWNDVKSYGGRTILRDICQSFEYVNKDNVQVISEPACASAFIAYKYLSEVNKPYNGKILLVDYGGGTLDITLSDVKSNSEGVMEISVLEKFGAGENSKEDRNIGRAGIIYMHSVVEEAIKLAGQDEEGFVERDEDFFSAVNDLETEMVGSGKMQIEMLFSMNNMDVDMLKDAMEEYEDDEDEEDQWLFTTLEYHGEDIRVPYWLLLSVYNDVIAKTLTTEIDKMKAFMDEKKIIYMDPTAKDFKIVVVGGFGKYMPVRKQVEAQFKFAAVDNRRVKGLTDEDSEQAIALGAGLLSEGIVKFQRTAAFSIAVKAVVSGVTKINYAIKYREKIIPGRICYPKDADGKDYVYWLGNNSINEFIVNSCDDDRAANLATPKPHVLNMLKDIKTNIYKTAVIGFSMDESEVITLHVRNCIPFGPNDKIIIEEPEVVNGKVVGDYVLAKFGDMFDISIFNPAIKN